MSDSRGEAAAAVTPRWPRVIGMIGLVIGLLTILDKLDDLLIPLLLPAEQWTRLLAPEVADFVVASLPPPAILILNALIGLVLGVLLCLGSLRLRQRRISGVRFCRTWAWTAIAWTALSIAIAGFWLAGHAEELSKLAPTGLEPVAFGLSSALVVLLAYPIFLLLWLSRPRIREHYESWPD